MNTGLRSILRPESLEGAFRFMDESLEALPIAGGTDLVPLMKYGLKSPRVLISLDRIQDLFGVSEGKGGLRIGSMVTLAELASSATVLRHFPAVAESARSVASPQIRNQGTAGGNLLQDRRCLYYNEPPLWRAGLTPCYKLGGEVCHQVPSSHSCRALYCSDLAVTLLSFGAEAEIMDGKGTARLPVAELIQRHAVQTLGRRLLRGIILPFAGAGTCSRFLKRSPRAAIDFAAANMAVRFTPGDGAGGISPVAKLVIGAVSTVPFELDETVTTILHGPAGKEEIVRAAIHEADAKSGLIRESAPFPAMKRQVLHQVVREGVELLWGWMK
jgi:4-hydroxybenzoyl-CoA reductase subunit beta